VPLTVVRLRNTERVFTPGQFLFHTTDPVTIEIDLMETFNTGPGGEMLKVAELKARAGEILSQGANQF
jgi:1-acyl-sn-glycerol-3-phosphate acyltransferase